MARSIRRLNFILPNSRRAGVPNTRNHDADNFFKLLKIKIKNCSDGRGPNDNCKCKSNSKEICDSKKIKIYLKHVVPEWEKMTPNRLYKHIQKMHENAERIRQFEIDLTWRRALYFIPLFVIFFSAFGIAFFNFHDETNFLYKLTPSSAVVNAEKNNSIVNIANKFSISKVSKARKITTVEYIILIAIAFINTCLCYFLTKMNVESQRWQKNWECHIDYLQQILGFKLMQTCLRPRGGYFTIRQTNTFIGFFTFLVWYFLMLVLFIALLNMNSYFSNEIKNLFSEIKIHEQLFWWLVALTLIAILFFLNSLCCCLTGESLFKLSKKYNENSRFYIRDLEIFLKDDSSILQKESSNGEQEPKKKNKISVYFSHIITFILQICIFMLHSIIFSIPFIFLIIAGFIVK